MLFHINADNSLEIENVVAKKTILVQNEKDDEEVIEGGFLAQTSHGVIHVKRLENVYVIRKYDGAGKEEFQRKIEHTAVWRKMNTRRHISYLNFKVHTDKYMVFTSVRREYDTTLIVDLLDGTVSSVPFSVIGVIRGEDDNSIAGFVQADHEKKQFKVYTRNNEWSISKKPDEKDACETILSDSILAIALYNPFATGSVLSAYDINNGTVLWEADVQQLNVAHSEYFNTVILSLYENKLIMEGLESYGSYIQIFDIKTGKRLFSTLHKKE